MRRAPLVLALAASVALATSAAAQGDVADDALPTCASLGIARVAVMVPPGQTAEQLGETLRTGGVFPAGTQIVILQPQQFTALRNEAQFHSRMLTSLNLFLEQGINLQGTANMLVELDEEGTVVRVHPNSGDPEVNRILNRTWRVARFEPYVMDGCRVKAWIQVPQTFSSNWGYERREVEVRSTPPSPR